MRASWKNNRCCALLYSHITLDSFDSVHEAASSTSSRYKWYPKGASTSNLKEGPDLCMAPYVRESLRIRPCRKERDRARLYACSCPSTCHSSDCPQSWSCRLDGRLSLRVATAHGPSALAPCLHFGHRSSRCRLANGRQRCGRCAAPASVRMQLDRPAGKRLEFMWFTSWRNFTQKKKIHHYEKNLHSG